MGIEIIRQDTSEPEPFTMADVPVGTVFEAKLHPEGAGCVFLRACGCVVRLEYPECVWFDEEDHTDFTGEVQLYEFTELHSQLVVLGRS